MRVAILTFDGFDEIGVFLPFNLLNRLSGQGWKAEITSPSARVMSAHGVTVEAQQPLSFANQADAVVFAGNSHARSIADPAIDSTAARSLLDRLELDPLRQLIAGQCSGTLLMAKLGLLGDMPACTDPPHRRWLLEAGVRVADGPFHARGPIATAGGGLASPCLAAWIMAKGAGLDAAASALQQAAPVGEQDAYVERVLAVVRPFVTTD